jgi:tRNA(Arg) A34 adenosine deaminase TadA
MEKDALFMKRAIELSALAVARGNEPFGAVLVCNGETVYENENQIYTANDPTFHAEMGLLRRFCAETKVTDLSGYTLYSSCEPCYMCSGAMVWAKLGRLVYGASDIDLCNLIGSEGSECSRIVFENSPVKPTVTAGVLREESLRVLAGYFTRRALPLFPEVG